VRYHVLIHPEAEEEVKRAYAWLQKESPVAAERWRTGLLKKVATLAKFPERCPFAQEAEKLGEPVRQLLYGRRLSSRYRLLFVIEGDTVTVLHVRHGAQRRLADDRG
jgi:toxin ParE1/3/4